MQNSINQPTQTYMNSNTGTTGTVTVSGAAIPTYLGTGWVPNSLVTAALEAGWSLVMVPGVNDFPNPATLQSYQIQDPGGLSPQQYPYLCGGVSGPGFLCDISVESVSPEQLEGASVSPGRVPAAGFAASLQGAVYDIGGDVTECAPANLLASWGSQSGRILVNQRFVHGLGFSPGFRQQIHVNYSAG